MQALSSPVCSHPSGGWSVLQALPRTLLAGGFSALAQKPPLAQSPLIVSDISLHWLSCSSASQRLLLWDATLPKLLSLILEIH